VVGGFAPGVKKDPLDFSVLRYNQNGSLDSTFGAGGIVKTAVSSGQDQIRSLAIQPDGKIIVGGYATVSKPAFALARYNTNGTLDTSFDGDGKVTTSFRSRDADIFDIAIQSDGKIVAVGGVSGSGSGIVRYNQNGSLDPTFGSGGIVTTPGTNGARSVALQPDGKILVGGLAATLGGLARYNSNGTLDTSFDGDGFVAISVVDRAEGIVVQPDGKIVVSGVSGPIDYQRVARLNANGSLDTTFGTGGYVNAEIWTTDVILQADGKIVVTGEVEGSTQLTEFALERLNADGSFDVTFAGDGLGTAAFGTFAGARQAAIQTDGNIIVAGVSRQLNSSINDIAIARFLGDPPAASASTQSADETDAALLFLFGEDLAPTSRRRK
jgi:uncharacterized delta-60 repeat protein